MKKLYVLSDERGAMLPQKWGKRDNFWSLPQGEKPGEWVETNFSDFPMNFNVFVGAWGLVNNAFRQVFSGEDSIRIWEVEVDGESRDRSGIYNPRKGEPSVLSVERLRLLREANWSSEIALMLLKDMSEYLSEAQAKFDAFKHWRHFTFPNVLEAKDYLKNAIEKSKAVTNFSGSAANSAMCFCVASVERITLKYRSQWLVERLEDYLDKKPQAPITPYDPQLVEPDRARSVISQALNQLVSSCQNLDVHKKSGYSESPLWSAKVEQDGLPKLGSPDVLYWTEWGHKRSTKVGGLTDSARKELTQVVSVELAHNSFVYPSFSPRQIIEEVEKWWSSTIGPQSSEKDRYLMADAILTAGLAVAVQGLSRAHEPDTFWFNQGWENRVFDAANCVLSAIKTADSITATL